MILALVFAATMAACPTVYEVRIGGSNSDLTKLFLFPEDAVEWATEYLPTDKTHRPVCVDDPVTVQITAREGTNDELIELAWCDADPCDKRPLCAEDCDNDLHKQYEDEAEDETESDECGP